jgi:hypothetical protein
LLSPQVVFSKSGSKITPNQEVICCQIRKLNAAKSGNIITFALKYKYIEDG